MFLLLSASLPAHADDDTTRLLVATCTTCHAPGNPATAPIPGLAGRPQQELLARLREFRDGDARATLMPQLLRGYTDDELARVAALFAAQTTAAPVTSPGQDKNGEARP